MSATDRSRDAHDGLQRRKTTALLDLQSAMAETRWRRRGGAGLTRAFDATAVHVPTPQQRLMAGAGPRHSMTEAVANQRSAAQHRRGVMRARTQRSALASAVEAHYDASLDHARHLTFDPKGAAIAKGAKAERKRDDAALLQQLCEIGGRTSVNNNRAAVRVARARGVDRVRRVLTQRTRADRVRVSKNADMRRRNARAKSSYDAKQQQEEYAALAQVRRRLTTRPVDPPMPRPPRVFGGCSSIEGAQERLREVRRAMGETRDRFQRTAATVRRRGERRDGRASAQAASRTARVAVAVAAPRVTYAAFAQTATAAMGIALPEYDAAYDPHCSYATTRTYFARRAAAEKAEEADREARIAQYRLPQRAAVPVRQPFDLRATGVQRAQETVSATAAAAKSSSSHSAGAGAGAGAGLTKLLYQACVRGLDERAEWLLRRGANVHYVHPANGRTPLHAACASALEGIALLMLDEFGADVCACDRGGLGYELPVGTSVTADFKSKGRWLGGKVIKIVRRSARETHAADAVAAKADSATAHLNIGAAFGSSSSSPGGSKKREAGEAEGEFGGRAESSSALAFKNAVAYDLRFDDGDRERAVQRTRIRLAQPDAIIFAGGSTPLHLAAARGLSSFIARAVAHYGADPVARNAEGYTPIDAAWGFGHDDLARRLEAMATMNNHRLHGGRFSGVL